jgi:hypothetical protein
MHESLGEGPGRYVTVRRPRELPPKSSEPSFPRASKGCEPSAPQDQGESHKHASASQDGDAPLPLPSDAPGVAERGDEGKEMSGWDGQAGAASKGVAPDKGSARQGEAGVLLDAAPDCGAQVDPTLAMPTGGGMVQQICVTVSFDKAAFEVCECLGCRLGGLLARWLPHVMQNVLCSTHPPNAPAVPWHAPVRTSSRLFCQLTVLSAPAPRTGVDGRGREYRGAQGEAAGAHWRPCPCAKAHVQEAASGHRRHSRHHQGVVLSYAHALALARSRMHTGGFTETDADTARLPCCLATCAHTHVSALGRAGKEGQIGLLMLLYSPCCCVRGAKWCS